ncbi:hypothetical protein LOD99_4050 [Oopsacas minuta]|uniref:Uncharacterized protein n=1 Tax=Oopsacas minuta TaxID=111878 RepID=A0AAV7JW29_9METZ|nr:hypothetical protein LOD99_4050 [Oopsacas minuta]
MWLLIIRAVILERNQVPVEKPIKLVSTHCFDNLHTIDIEKVKGEFNAYATEEFCSNLKLGLTQNANESLHNTIWILCPNGKYVSLQSIRISTAIAILTFNEGELSQLVS